jgi:cyclopropane-fatty-acyl-phospholipid synthase
MWNGATWLAEQGQPTRFTFVIRHPGALRSILLAKSELALGQAYIYEDIDVEGDLESAMSLAEYLFGLHLMTSERLRIARHLFRLPSLRGERAGRQPAALDGELHSIDRDRAAVTYHYNTSNDFFGLYLDRRMIYSCAYFQDPGQDLESAQERKLDYICRKLRLRSGERLLDIGCGWGALILYAAQRYGVSALGITLSEPQAVFANDRIQREGLGQHCEARVCDYRQLKGAGSFDKIVSVGMVEHVGEKRLPE